MRTEPTSRVIPGLAAAGVLLGLAIGLGLQHQTRLELHEEQLALQQQLERVTELLAENEKEASLVVTANPAQSLASESASELLRLRAEVEALRQVTNEWESASNENTEAHGALEGYLASEAAPRVATADFWPRDSWSFAGFNSPDDALRSSLWASDNGNVKALLDSTTGEVRQTLEKEYAGAPADEAAIRVMDEVVNFKSVEVLNREYQSEDTAVLTAALENGDQTNTMKLVLKKIGNQWKIAGEGN